ncbi:bacteriocin-like protein [Chryseobacterium gallinarum]
MKNLKKLLKNDLKTIEGGFIKDDGCRYKCCWNNQPGNCSETIMLHRDKLLVA